MGGRLGAGAASRVHLAGGWQRLGASWPRRSGRRRRRAAGADRCTRVAQGRTAGGARLASWVAHCSAAAWAERAPPGRPRLAAHPPYAQAVANIRPDGFTPTASPAAPASPRTLLTHRWWPASAPTASPPPSSSAPTTICTPSSRRARVVLVLVHGRAWRACNGAAAPRGVRLPGRTPRSAPTLLPPPRPRPPPARAVPHLWLHRRRRVLLPRRQAGHRGVPVRLFLKKKKKAGQAGRGEVHGWPASRRSACVSLRTRRAPGAGWVGGVRRAPRRPPCPDQGAPPVRAATRARAAAPRRAWARATATSTASASRRSGWSCRRRGGRAWGTEGCTEGCAPAVRAPPAWVHPGRPALRALPAPL